jgi:RHS repeat-associated protein
MEMKAFINITNNAFGTTTYNGRYNNRFTYDENGNIASQVRKNQAGTTFDSLTYRYNKDSQGRKTQNRLYHVNDTITANVMSDDIDNEGVFNSAISTINTKNNYSYDNIGNLVRDSAEGIVTIDWTVYGKIKSITHRTGYYKMSGTDTVRPPDLLFNYDASGNRISKVSKPRTATGTQASNYWTTQYYVRDAQGNILSTYVQHDSVAISTAYFTQIEKHIYGSQRIGIENTQTQLIGATFNTDTSNHYLGNKSFELTNHLGNVLTTVSDKKLPVDTTAHDTINFFVADVRSATDFSPFGAPLDQRTFNAGADAYGANGKEKDNEVYGEGNEYDYGMRHYDPRLGRFMSVDPLAHNYPELSTYQFASNTPIQGNDLDGMELNSTTTYVAKNYPILSQADLEKAQAGATKSVAEAHKQPQMGIDYIINGLKAADKWVEKWQSMPDKGKPLATGQGGVMQTGEGQSKNVHTSGDPEATVHGPNPGEIAGGVKSATFGSFSAPFKGKFSFFQEHGLPGVIQKLETVSQANGLREAGDKVGETVKPILESREEEKPDSNEYRFTQNQDFVKKINTIKVIKVSKKDNQIIDTGSPNFKGSVKYEKEKQKQ